MHREENRQILSASDIVSLFSSSLISQSSQPFQVDQINHLDKLCHHLNLWEKYDLISHLKHFCRKENVCDQFGFFSVCG